MKKYYVYVIELDSEVAKFQKFRQNNPHYNEGKECLYVGQSSRKPELRFDQHKEGYKSNRYAREYGLRLMPELYAQYNPIPTRKDAEEMEAMLGEQLRTQGFGVWFS